MDRVTQYAEDVVKGNIKTGLYAKLACQRHLNDLEKSNTDEFEYYFNVEKANKILDFAETLIIAEGEEETPVVLEGFQIFILGSLNGWVNKINNHRRFRNSYVQLGRQNGKSFLNGILATFYGNFSGYNYGQIYCTATKMDQAKIVFREIMKFINADKDLQELFKIKEYESTIECKLTKSTIKALGKDTKSIDGFRPLLGIVDEYHAHKDNQMYKLLEGGTRRMKECLISVITTAGFEINCPCYELYEYCCNLLIGLYTNEKQFVYITQMDKDDDIWNYENWIKANPLVCKDKENLENLISVGKTAKDIGGNDLRDFLVKGLNNWMQLSDNQYILVDDWKKCATNKTLKDFRGYKCNIGLDLSSGGDLTSLALIFVFMDGKDKKYFIHSHSFIPKMRVEEHIKTDRVPYDLWIKKGLLTVTETIGGIKTDYKYILRYLNDIICKYDLKVEQIGYDPRNADTFLVDLEEIGDCVEIYQSARSLNDATEDFRLEIKAGNIEYNKENELLTWSIINAKVVYNGEFVKIDKNKSHQRIDPIDAIIDAYKLAFKDTSLIDYNELTNEYLNMMGW
ncbi:TPA: terminase TerL endonuclease subunit [Clostridioides difficile]|uniref:terminase large subunit n=1 Tax=Clostridioides difficile TaxID=1496 RepID=UPI00093D293A|nr:terminase TerL endonuclease subunit [Clostridioides difficile]EGT3831890.1 terminase large subunit [Clostridioides difficile]EGT4017621.1 terminase large subunit [Clostridioides difficile]MCF8947608.1 terminase large subunit [Clostridioides difficile]MCK1918934.1 terminase large subunit [Clostridioides difficile]MCL6800030.1 terminase large subunit [Clostridioides difficile]